MRMNKDSEDKNTEYREGKYEVMDTSKTITNENRATNDELKDSEEKNAEYSEGKYEAMDTSETITNENGATNDELKDSEEKNAEYSEGKYEVMDTSETITNENGATNDEPNVAVGNFSLSDELHGPESLPNYGDSSHSTPTKCESKRKGKYIENASLKTINSGSKRRNTVKIKQDS
ncbi:hypothetical protein AVEN_270732-1 [Araneus ventricosus]|uniref:Uncharacterized protein n=1 Tax=Araneus ventricosus TaxID=182803 RepID=A0A4Y2UPM6_ARAVE|nr:hypothetical protein AVEN_270732-1 [Araneus ventricosus]